MSEAGSTNDADWSLRTVATAGEIRFGGWRLIGDGLLRDGEGRLLWIPNPPARRLPVPGGPVVRELVDWDLTMSGDGVTLRATGGDAEVDLVELGAAAGDAFLADRSEVMMVHPTGASFGGPRDLADYLLGDDVMVTWEGRAWATEQVALSLYRIARRRGGPLWGAVAAHLADAVARRVEQADDRGPVQGFWERGESHVRLLADAVLLLVAHAEYSGDERFAQAAMRSADQLSGYGVPWGGGVWYLHDSLEREAGRNNLVLNTHVHAMLALIAADRPVSKAGRALGSALSLASRRPGAYGHAASIAAADLLTAWAPGAGHRLGRRLGRAAQSGAAAFRRRHPHLRQPGGYVARDIGGEPAHSRYLAINLHDLAILSANGSAALCRDALRGGFRYAAASGYVRGELRSGDPTVSVLLPKALSAVGHRARARALADRSRERGWAPAIGWPGYEDRLWSRLAPGAP